MTTTSTTAQKALSDAHRKLDDARANATAERDKVAEMERAIMSGDTTINGGDLAKQEGVARIAELRVTAVQSEFDQAETTAEKEQAKQVRKEADATEFSIGHLTELMDGIETAVSQFLDAMATRNYTITSLRKKIRALGDEATAENLDTADEYTVSIGDRVIKMGEPEAFVHNAIEAAFQKHGLKMDDAFGDSGRSARQTYRPVGRRHSRLIRLDTK